jgi:hypothetical protein
MAHCASQSNEQTGSRALRVVVSSRYRLRVAVLENELDAETTREKLDALLNIIGAT